MAVSNRLDDINLHIGMCPCVATDRKYLYEKNQYLYINLILVQYIFNFNISHGKNTIIFISQIVLSCKKNGIFLHCFGANKGSSAHYTIIYTSTHN
jgi:hypothetical protein